MCSNPVPQVLSSGLADLSDLSCNFLCVLFRSVYLIPGGNDAPQLRCCRFLVYAFLRLVTTCFISVQFIAKAARSIRLAFSLTGWPILDPFVLGALPKHEVEKRRMCHQHMQEGDIFIALRFVCSPADSSNDLVVMDSKLGEPMTLELRQISDKYLLNKAIEQCEDIWELRTLC
ncbi:hypothetical protein VTK73DRAFT_5736 [Phialemonium thermophilum]|uniref:Uncharacterized protein n=1 Tax=Phialemonium thermophilum TaxID=223376 RepID=A0ABR3WMD3_9PEZI